MSELMRRATPGLAVAGAALATVWLFDPAMHPDGTATQAAAAPGSVSEPGSGDSGSSGNGHRSRGSTTPDDTGNVPDTPQAAPATGDCSSTSAVTGDSVMTNWGPVQVRMEFAADGSVCDVRAVAYPDNDRKSSQINARAIPYLDAQATTQGVEFDALSGATYTSEAYRASMQSILDRR